MSTEALIQIKNVSRTFRRGSEEIHVLSQLDLEVKAGDFLALMGPSGSGKSTLLNLIGGLDRADAGSVQIGEDRIDQLSDRQLAAWRARHVGFVSSFTISCRRSTPRAMSSCRCCSRIFPKVNARSMSRPPSASWACRTG